MKSGRAVLAAAGALLASSLGASPLAVDGVLDLRRHDFVLDGSVELQGEFIARNFSGETPGPAYRVALPGPWAGPALEAPPRGVVEYQLTVLLPPDPRHMALVLSKADSAAEYRINSSLVGLAGRPGVSLEGEVMWRGHRAVSVPELLHDRIDLRIRASNFHEPQGGVYYAPALGDAEQLFAEHQRATVISAALIGLLLMIAAYHGLVFALTGRKTVGALALFTAIISLRLLFDIPVAIGALLDLSGAWPMAVEVGSYYLAVLAFSVYFRSLFAAEYPRIFNRIVVLVSMVALLTLPFGPMVYLQALIPYQIFSLLFLVIVLVVWLRAAFRRTRSTFGFGLGMVALLGGAAAEILHALVYGSVPGYIAPGIAAFALIQTATLAQRSASDFNERGRLARSLQEATNDLAELNELSRQANANIDIHEILGAMQQYTARHFGFEIAWLLLVSPDRKELRGLALAGDFDADQAEFAYQFRTPLDNSSGALFHVVRRKKPAGLRAVSSHRIRHATEANFARVFRAESVVLLPLIFAESCIGVLLLISPVVRDSAGRSQLPRLMNAANLVVSAVRNATLLDEAVRQRNRAQIAVAESEKLGEFMRDVHSSVELKETLDKISEFLVGNFGMDRVWFLRIEEEDGIIRNLHAFDRAQDIDPVRQSMMTSFSAPLRPETGALFRTYDRRKTLYLDRFLRLDQLNPVDRLIVETWRISKLVLIPLIVQEKVIGIAALSSSEAHERKLNREQLASLDRFCNQVATAIYAASMVEELEVRRNQAAAARAEADELNAFSRVANESTALEQVMDALAHNVARRFGFRLFWFLGVNQETREIRTEYYRAEAGALAPDQSRFLESFRIPLEASAGTLFWSVRRRRPLYLPALPDRSSIVGTDRLIVDTLDLHALVHLPVQARGEVIGIVALTWNPDEIRRLSRRQLHALERLGNQAAGAIYNLRVLKQVEAARADSERLLLSILPESIAAEIKTKGQASPRRHESVTILFTDFVGFTAACQWMQADQIITELDACFTFFDEVARRHSLEKLKTIGDAYMCAGGIPTPNWTHPIDACLAALEFQRFIEQMKEVKQYQGAAGWELRVGINTGPVVAGVVGVHKFAYDIWGDAVNTASRIESSGAPGRVNVSENTYQLTAQFFDFENRGSIEVKGKGLVPMYFLKGLKKEFARDAECCVPNERFLEEYHDRKAVPLI